MYGKILVGYDSSDQAEDAVSLGRALAAAEGARLVIAGVFRFDPLWSRLEPGFEKAEIEYARQIERVAAEADAEPEAVPSSSPARGLHDLAEEIGADLILVGSARHGHLGAIAAGSVGQSLLHGSPCAVGIAPGGYRDEDTPAITTVMVAFDGSPESALALDAAVDLARTTGAGLKLMAVADAPPMGLGKGPGAGQGRHELQQAIEKLMRDRLREATERLPPEVETETVLASGDPAEELTEASGDPGTLLLLGSRGYGPLRRVLLGSVSQQLVRSARCPLIVHPRGIHAARSDERVRATESAQ